MSGRPWVEPVTLEGSVVRLEPLSLDHLPGLTMVGLDAEIWRWMTRHVQSPADMRAVVDEALAAAAAGTEVPFATVERTSGRPVGSTRFLNIEPRHRRLEIGWTWIAPAWQRSAVNTEAKLLMLSHAFTVLRAARVEFKTDALNEWSRAALLRIGSVEEGTLRRHMLIETGRQRDSVYYSVIDEEWPRVRRLLEARLARLARLAPATDQAIVGGPE